MKFNDKTIIYIHKYFEIQTCLTYPASIEGIKIYVKIIIFTLRFVCAINNLFLFLLITTNNLHQQCKTHGPPRLYIIHRGPCNILYYIERYSQAQKLYMILYLRKLQRNVCQNLCIMIILIMFTCAERFSYNIIQTSHHWVVTGQWLTVSISI